MFIAAMPPLKPLKSTSPSNKAPAPYSSQPGSPFRLQFSSAPWIERFFAQPLMPCITAPQDPDDPSPWTFMRSVAMTHDCIIAQKSYLAAAGYLSPDEPDSPHHVGTLVTLFSFGTGTQGHEGMAHGGFVAAVLDQEMGSMVRLDPGNKDPLSVQLGVRYKKAMAVPGVYVCKSWVTKREGRKLWLAASLENGWKGEDGKGGCEVLATAEAMFIVNVPREKLVYPSKL